MTTWPQGIAFKNQSQAACAIRLARRLAASTARRTAEIAVLIGSKLPLTPKTAVLGFSLILSALLTAETVRLPERHWLAWISFLPLFIVVRSLRPSAAALAGAFWGGCLYLFYIAEPAPAVDSVVQAIGPSTGLLPLLVVIPAVYLGLAAQPARAIGFRLLTLALGWTLIEVVLHVHGASGSHEALLGGTESEAQQLHWLARLLGYVSTAFLVACANASLVSILGGVRLSCSSYQSTAGSPYVVGHLAAQIVLPFQGWTLRQAHPRAPPV